MLNLVLVDLGLDLYFSVILVFCPLECHSSVISFSKLLEDFLDIACSCVDSVDSGVDLG